MAIDGLVGNFQLMIRTRTSSGSREKHRDEQAQNECEGLLTVVECLESLKSMEPNKSP